MHTDCVIHMLYTTTERKIESHLFCPLLVVTLNCRSFDLRLTNTEGIWTTFHHAQKYLGAYLLATKTLKLIKWLTSTAHSSGALNSHPRQTQLKVNFRPSDKSGLCCGCHQRLVVVHTNFLTYVSNLLSNLCYEWQPSLPGCRTAWSTITKSDCLRKMLSKSPNSTSVL